MYVVKVNHVNRTYTIKRVQRKIVIERSGRRGLPGPAGADGPPGADGESAYQVWLDEGNTGTEQDFLDSLQGEQGIPGQDGAPGVVQSVVAGDNVTVDDTDPANPVVSAEATSGAVDSVNSQTGVVVLDQDDIGDGTTYKQYSQTDKTKLAGIESGAETNNISDSDATDLTDGGNTTLHIHDSRYYTESETDTLLSNKQPLDADLTALAAAGNSAVLAATTASFLTADETKLDGIEAGADVTDATNVAAAGAFMKSTDDADDITAGTTNKFSTATEKTKLGFISVTQAVDLDTMESDIASKQPLDSDLTTIAGLTPSNDDLLQRKAGAWVNRTPTQVKTDLALTKADVNLGNVDDTSDANKPVSTATQTALNLKLDTSAYDDATVAETNTGTSTSKYVSPDGLAGSYAGTKSVGLYVVEATTDVTTGDGKAYIPPIPAAFNGMDLVSARAAVITAGTTNPSTIQIHNVTQAADMLSGLISIASGATSGIGTPDTSNDDIATGDVLRIDVDSVSTTAPKGLLVTLEFRLP